MPQDQLDLHAYLGRIGLAATGAPSLTLLRSVIARHTGSIPFENLDIVLGRPIRLDIGSVQAKLVGAGRGGYCFEQNTLFKAALEAIGFKVTGLGARVRWMSPPDSPLGPREHMLLKVDLPEGPHLADVGFGACVLDAPLQFRTNIEQRTAMGSFRLTESDGLFTLSAKQAAGWRTAYVFNLEPQIEADYELGNWFTSTNPSAPFLNVLIMERVGADRRYKLIDRRVVIEARDGEVVEERLVDSAEALHQTLEETFNVVPPAPVEKIFTRISG
jgi:N-hydroxyarylamine O-acetyltransferase